VVARAVAAALVLVGLVGGCSGDDGGSAARSGSTATAGVPRSQGWRVVELEGRPAAALSADGLLVVVDDELGELQRVALDPAQAGAAPEPIGGQLVGLSISPEATWAIDASGTAIHLEEEPLAVDLGGTLVDVVQAQGHVYVGDLEGRRVVELDAGSGAVQRTFAVPEGVVRIAEAGGVLWVTGAERTVTPIDLERGTVRSAADVGAGPIGLAVAGGTVWVANGDDGTVSRLDAATGQRRGDDVRVGAGPIAVAVSGDDVWVLNQDAGTVSHLSASTGDRVEPDVPLPASLSRGRDLVATPTGIAVVGVDASQAAFLPTR
jgi:DNA-binding beta-propeller fold protein YncE